MSHKEDKSGRAFLVSSRTNSRPQLPRYASSAASLVAVPAAAAAAACAPAASEASEAERSFARRRDALLAEWRALPAGCVATDASEETEEEEQAALGSRAALGESLPEGEALGCYTTGYSDAPPLTGNYTNLPAPGSLHGSPLGLPHNGVELSRLEQFHGFIAELSAEKGRGSFRDRLHKFEQLVGVVENFLYEAQLFGKIILQEISKPAQEKTIKPLQSTGVSGSWRVALFVLLTEGEQVLGGDKFLHGGIYFKLAVDRAGLLGGFGGATKLVRHEIKSLAALMAAGVGEIQFPLVCLVSYCGLSILAMTQLPISAQSLVYGSSDAGKTLHFEHPRSMALCAELGRRLNLRGHRPRNCDKTIYTPVDMELHETAGGALYALDFSRLFPPTWPRKDVQGSQFIHLFRPEFVAKGFAPSLCFFCSLTLFPSLSPRRSAVQRRLYQLCGPQRAGGD